MVEAVGIEPSPEHLGSHDSVAITRRGVDSATSVELCESELLALLGTHVPSSESGDALLERARLGWGAMRVICAIA